MLHQHWAVEDWNGTIHVGRCKEEAFKNAKEGMNHRLRKITKKCYQHFSKTLDPGFYYNRILDWITDVNEKEEIENFLRKRWG